MELTFRVHQDAYVCEKCHGSLNPCFCGTYFSRNPETQNRLVLILVFVELTFRVKLKIYNYETTFDVLILVFVELTFRACKSPYK